jgi:hypothetical protein
MNSVELKNHIIEEIEFDLFNSTSFNQEELIPGLERALQIIDNIDPE